MPRVRPGAPRAHLSDGGAHPEKGAPPARRGRAAALALVLMPALAGIIAGGLAGGCGRRSAATAPAPEQAVPVAVVTAARGPIEEAVTIPGRVVARAEATLSAKIPGRVSAVLVSLGDRVRRGQVLVRLDGADLAAQVEQARAAWEAARNSRERMRLLYAEGAISRQQWEQAELQATQAAAALDAARAALANASITAPMDGWVTSVSAEVGQIAGPGVPLVTVADTSRLEMEASLTDTQAARIAPGQEVRVEAEAVPGVSVRGSVEAVAPAGDPQRRSFPVRMALLDPPPGLKAGMFARAVVTLERRDDALLIPVAAALGQGAKRYVFVVEDGKARLRTIVPGISDGVNLEVKSGLRAGERVVVSGQHYLRDGAPVRVNAAEAEGR